VFPCFFFSFSLLLYAYIMCIHIYIYIHKYTFTFFTCVVACLPSHTHLLCFFECFFPLKYICTYVLTHISMYVCMYVPELSLNVVIASCAQMTCMYTYIHVNAYVTSCVCGSGCSFNFHYPHSCAPAANPRKIDVRYHDLNGSPVVNWY
jgi:hypothetical protein